MKTKEELNALKAEMIDLSSKLAELSDEELMEVVGGNEEFSILPRNQIEFWRSWNPGFLTNAAHSDTTDFIDTDDYIHKLTHE